MKCPRCHEEISGPVAGPKQLRCPECKESLVQLELIFNPEELEAFKDVIVLAMRDPVFYENLRQDPLNVLEEKGISQKAVTRLTKVIEAISIPVVPTSMTDADSWPQIEFLEEEVAS